MMIRRQICAAVTVSTLTLCAGCSGTEPDVSSERPVNGTGATEMLEEGGEKSMEENIPEKSVLLPAEALHVTGAKTGAYVSLLLNGPSSMLGGDRPPATLGVYVSLYLAQGAFMPVSAALKSIDTMEKILVGGTSAESSETFTLLKEFGSILQVDIVDTMNRSRNRAEALDQYVRSLRNIMELAQRKIVELHSKKEELDERQKSQRTIVRDIDGTISEALRDKDYELAGSKQEESVMAKSMLAKVETELEQTKDILDPYEKMMEVAGERVNAIEKNRAIMIAGLKVVEVPGIDDLNLIDEESSWRSRILPGNAL